jgi:uncharacterized damage-inducible protein DinB
MTHISKPKHDYETLDMLFRHNLWANTILFELCAGLSEEQLSFSIPGTFGSIGKTLAHIAFSERSYLHRITSGKPYPRPKDAPAPTWAELQEMIRQSGEGLLTAAPRVQAQDSLEVDWDGSPRQVPATLFLTQSINHATEHRAQVMVMLTQLGIQPPDLDGWSYFDAAER